MMTQSHTTTSLLAAKQRRISDVRLFKTTVYLIKTIILGLAVDVEFLTHTTQHKNQDDVDNIRSIIGSRRDAKGRWLEVSRHPDHIDKEQATQAEVAEWEEYQCQNPGGDRVLEHLGAPSSTPQILDVSYAADGEINGYTRSFPPKYELVENIHCLLVEEWEESEDYADLAEENGW